jgi:glutamyl-tRNA reductase
MIGLNHRSAPVELRERLALTEEGLAAGLADLASFSTEAYILSTCNRTELYVVTGLADPWTALTRFLATRRGVPIADIEGRFYTASDDEAVRNLFRVASGLDSMVLGEAQILGQVREAFEVASAVGSVGRILGRVLPLALEIGKRARSETRIGRGALSPSSVAIELARRAVGDLGKSTVLVVGAGDAAQAATRALADAGVRAILVVNRSLPRAEHVASAVGGHAVPFVDLPAAVPSADIVICSTGAPEPIISADLLRGAMERRPDRPLLCIDIAVPRDVDPAANTVPGIQLYNIDDLEAVCATNLLERQQEIGAVEAIIGEGLEDYRSWCQTQHVTPTISALYQWADQIRQSEVDRTLRRLPTLSQDQRDLINTMTDSLVRRLLHGPVSALKAQSDQTEAAELAQGLRQLFALDADAPEGRRRTGSV